MSSVAFGYHASGQPSSSTTPQFTTRESSFNPYLHAPDYTIAETPQPGGSDDSDDTMDQDTAAVDDANDAMDQDTNGSDNSNDDMDQDTADYQGAGPASFSETLLYPAALMDMQEEPYQAGLFENQEQAQQSADQAQTFTAEEIAYLFELAAQQDIPVMAQQQQECNAPGIQVPQQESDNASPPVFMQTELAPRLFQPVYRLPVEDESPVMPTAEPFQFDMTDNFTLQDALDALAVHANAEGAASEFDWNNVDPILRPNLEVAATETDWSNIDPNLLAGLAALPTTDIIAPEDVDWARIPGLADAPANAGAEQDQQVDSALAQFPLPALDDPEMEAQYQDFLLSVVASYQADANPLAARFDLPGVDPEAGPLDQVGAQWNAWLAQQQTELILYGERSRHQFESAYYAEIEPRNAVAGPSTQPLSVPPATAGSSSRKRTASADEEDIEAGPSQSGTLSTAHSLPQAVRPLPRRAIEGATSPATATVAVGQGVLASPAVTSAVPSEPEQVFGPQSPSASLAAESSTATTQEPGVANPAAEMKLGKRAVPLDDNLDSGRNKLTRSAEDGDVSTASPPESPTLEPATPSTATSETLPTSTASTELSSPTTPTQERPIRHLSAKARGKLPALTPADDESD